MDDNLREPIGFAARPTQVTVQAQVTFRRQDAPQAEQEALNVEQHSDGWLTLLVRSLLAANVTLKRGDKIIQIGTGALAMDVEYYLTRKQPLGHSGPGSQLLRFYFADRQPIE